MFALNFGDGTLVDLEIQKSPFGYTEDRCLQYWSILYSSTLKKTNDYTSAKKTICIWIIDGEVYPNEENYDLKWKVMCENSQTKMCFDKFEIHTIELKKFRKSAIINPRDKDFWLWFIDHTNKEMVNMACSRFDKIEKLQKKLNELTADPAVEHELLNRQMALYDRTTELNEAVAEGEARGKAEGLAEGKAEGKAEGLAEGLAEGELKGKAKEKLKIAKNMLIAKIPLEQICIITGLMKEDLEKIKI